MYTIWLSTQKQRILTTPRIYVSRRNLKINSYYFHTQILAAGFCKWYSVYCEVEIKTFDA